MRIISELAATKSTYSQEERVLREYVVGKYGYALDSSVGGAKAFGAVEGSKLLKVGSLINVLTKRGYTQTENDLGSDDLLTYSKETIADIEIIRMDGKLKDFVAQVAIGKAYKPRR